MWDLPMTMNGLRACNGLRNQTSASSYTAKMVSQFFCSLPQHPGTIYHIEAKWFLILAMCSYLRAISPMTAPSESHNPRCGCYAARRAWALQLSRISTERIRFVCFSGASGRHGLEHAASDAEIFITCTK